MIDLLTHWTIGSLIRWLHDWFTDSLNHWFIDSLIRWPHWFIDSLAHWFIDLWFIDSLMCWVHWFIASMLHWIIDTLLYWFINPLLSSFSDSLVHCFIGSLIPWCSEWLIDWLTDWLIGWLNWLVHRLNPLIHWFVPSSFIGSLVLGSSIHWLIDLFSQLCMDSFMSYFIGISTNICSFVDAPHNFNTSLLLHLKYFPIGLLRIVVSNLRNFRPGMGTIWYEFYLTWWICTGKREYRPTIRQSSKNMQQDHPTVRTRLKDMKNVA